MIELKNKSPKILVIGDLMIDQYFWGESDRISPEAPVQIIDISKVSNTLGGAGNVINNLKTFGANVDVISVIGNCNNSQILKDLLSEININPRYLIIDESRITSKKSRIIASQQQVIRYDQESTSEISVSSQKMIFEIFEKNFLNYDVILFSDYGKGIFTNKLTKDLINIAAKKNKKVLIDPKGSDFSKYKGAYLLTPNMKEAAEATNINIINNKALLSEAIIKLKLEFELGVSLITMSEKGIAIYDNELRVFPTSSKEVFDVTGAGDTVLAALGFSLACNLDIYQSVNFANLAAGVVVGKIGSATASFNEIIEYESSLNKSSSDFHIKSLAEIEALCEEFRLKGKKVVFTNGCFDIIHAGHVRYLETAKNYGDILILGLNSDRSVSALKGKGRPINCQLDRAYILAALEAVDYVVIFDEDDPYKLIKAIKPKILVKGADYKGKKVIGSDLVDELILVDFVKGKSSTETIQKIMQSD
jgi:D-beta-D-heptose 7-phosphate kinase / D-beta-D-heptose 1-phosphate adenosyltransferase